jgi:hypothetical protein
MIAGGGGVRNAAKPGAVTVSFPDKDTWRLVCGWIGSDPTDGEAEEQNALSPGAFSIYDPTDSCSRINIY